MARGQVWVTVAQRTVETTNGAVGVGTLRLGAVFDIDFTDTALAFYPQSWQLLYPACAKLVNYPDKPAPAGSQLKPEVAQALPSRSPDGKTYTFTIRNGFRFSPPSNEPVTAQTFKYTIERSLSPTMNGPARGYLPDVVGADAFISGKVPHITGVVADGNQLVIRLRAPAPDISRGSGLRSSARFRLEPRSTPRVFARSPPPARTTSRHMFPGKASC